MKCPVIETLRGIPNGINTIFRTSVPYRPNTVRVFRNGLLGTGVLTDGWVELGQDRIQLKEPPPSGDILQVYYIPF